MCVWCWLCLIAVCALGPREIIWPPQAVPRKPPGEEQLLIEMSLVDIRISLLSTGSEKVRHSVLSFFLAAKINFQLPDNYSFSLASAYGRLEQEMQCFFLIQWSFTLLHLHFQHLNKESKTVNDCFYFGFQLSWVLGNTNCTKYLGHWVGFWRDKSTKTLGTLCSKTKTLNNDWALKQKTRPTLLHQLTWSFVRCKINACIILLVRFPFNSILAALWLINLIMLTPTQLSLRWEISCMLSSYWRSLLLQIVGKLCNF